MTVDLSKLVFYSNAQSFKQNSTVQTGTFTITGTATVGLNSRTFTTTLATSPDMLDIVFNGPTDTVYGSDARPAGGWLKNGEIWVISDYLGLYTTPWKITSSISGTTLTVTALYRQDFVATQNLTSTDFYYRVIDYSVL